MSSSQAQYPFRIQKRTSLPIHFIRRSRTPKVIANFSRTGSAGVNPVFSIGSGRRFWQRGRLGKTLPGAGGREERLLQYGKQNVGPEQRPCRLDHVVYLLERSEDRRM